MSGTRAARQTSSSARACSSAKAPEAAFARYCTSTAPPGERGFHARGEPTGVGGFRA
jgi:hypothetical protein